MKRPHKASINTDDNIYGSLATLPSLSDQYLNELASPDHFQSSSPRSDTDSLSDSSKKIRKKRNAYQKISDEIRVQILELVQGGETLKAAAKRFKINYSSAKSILHTYRKEGRILKKSAQERVVKKRSVQLPDDELVYRPLTTPRRKESSKSTFSNKDYVDSAESNGKKVKGLSRRLSKEISPGSTYQVETGSVSSTKLDNNHEYQLEDQMKGYHTHSEVHPSVGMFNTMGNEAPMVQEGYMMGRIEANQPQTNFFDNVFISYPEPRAQTEQMNHQYQYQHQPQPQQTQQPQYNNYFDYSKDFDSFNDMLTNFHAKPAQNDFPCYDPQYLYNGGEPTSAHTLEDKTSQPGGGMDFEMGNENTFKSFMDTQNMFLDALRKGPVCTRGNETESRKGSLDLFQ